MEDRNRKIDALKGIGIILVILGHIHQTPGLIRIWIYSFHIPFFFLCSGLTFSLKRYPSFHAFFSSKTRSLVLPYFFLGSFLWVLTKVYQLLEQICIGEAILIRWDIKQFIVSLLLGYRLHEFYFSLWFLCTLFFSEILLYGILKVVKDEDNIYMELLQLYFLFYSGSYSNTCTDGIGVSTSSRAEFLSLVQGAALGYLHRKIKSGYIQNGCFHLLDVEAFQRVC